MCRYPISALTVRSINAWSPHHGGYRINQKTKQPLVDVRLPARQIIVSSGLLTDLPPTLSTRCRSSWSQHRHAHADPAPCGCRSPPAGGASRTHGVVCQRIAPMSGTAKAALAARSDRSRETIPPSRTRCTASSGATAPMRHESDNQQPCREEGVCRGFRNRRGRQRNL